MKKIAAVFLILLLLCGCTHEPEMTSIRTPPERLEHPPVPSSPEEVIVPVDAAFQAYYDLLYTSVMPGELYSLHYVTYFVFDAPEEIPMGQFFCNGFLTNGGWDSFSPEETAFLKEQPHVLTWAKAQKRTSGQMDTVLHALFGTDLSTHLQETPELWYYYPDMDSYYTTHDYFQYPCHIRISRVEDAGDALVIDYIFDNPNGPAWPPMVFTPKNTETPAGNMRMTLRRTETGAWIAVSNQMVSDQ